MKVMRALPWALATPVFLFAGASQALTISELTDPACSGGFYYNSQSNTIACNVPATSAPVCTPTASPTSVAVGGTATLAANCTQSPTSWNWTVPSGAPSVSGSGGTATFSNAGTFTYTVTGTNSAGTSAPSNVTVTVSEQSSTPVGGACPSTYQVPAGTVVVAMGGRDDYSKIEFNQSFDTPGNKIDSKTEAGQIKAWEFDNNAFLSGKITGTGGNYGHGIKNWSISACPGDFGTSVPAKCKKMGFTDITMYYHASDAAKGCVIPPGQKMYLNVTGQDPSQPVGYVVGNVPSATLP
jgi:hypothetical protein